MGLKVLLWNPRVASRRLLFLCVLLVLCVVTMRVLWGVSDRYVTTASRRDALRLDSHAHFLRDTHVKQAGRVREDFAVSAVEVPTAGVTMMSAIERADFPASAQRSLVLTGWTTVRRARSSSDILCCLSRSKGSLAKQTQVAAMVFHMDDISSNVTGDHYYSDIHLICDINSSSKTFRFVSFSTVSCEKPNHKSKKLVIHRPERPFGHRDMTKTVTKTHVLQTSNQNKDVHLASSSSPGEDPHTANGASKVYSSLSIDILVKSKELIGDSESEKVIKKKDVLVTDFKQKLDGNKRKQRFAACMGLVNFQGVTDVLQIVEWMEYFRILGAERVQMFYENASVRVASVLKFYAAQGLVNALKLLKESDGNRWPARQHGDLWRDLVHNDCLHRLSRYDFLLFTSPHHLIIPIENNVTLLSVLNSVLKTEPRTATVQLGTEVVPPCQMANQSQGQDNKTQGQSRRLGIIPDLFCPKAGHETAQRETWISVPGLVSHVAHRLVHVPLVAGDVKLNLPAHLYRSIHYGPAVTPEDRPALTQVTSDDTHDLVLTSLLQRLRSRLSCVPADINSMPPAGIPRTLSQCLGSVSFP